MGMSSHIVGIIPDTDPNYQKQKKVYMACFDAGIKPPQETIDYFKGYDDPYLIEDKLKVKVRTHEWNDGDMCEGFEIKISDIPPGVEKIRFYNSY